MIKTMTIDEIEAWWETHHEAVAYPSESSKCLIAVPLKATNEGFRTISVGPHDDEEVGEIEAYVDDGRLGPAEVIPLDPTLNRLALEFDRKGPKLVQNDDDGEGSIDGEGVALNGTECLAIIRTFKKETLGGTA